MLKLQKTGKIQRNLVSSLLQAGTYVPFSMPIGGGCLTNGGDRPTIGGGRLTPLVLPLCFSHCPAFCFGLQFLNFLFCKFLLISFLSNFIPISFLILFSFYNP